MTRLHRANNWRAVAVNNNFAGTNYQKYTRWLRKNGYVTKRCEYCGKEIWVKYASFLYAHKKYCSAYCRKAAYAERKKRGEVQKRTVGAWGRLRARVIGTFHKCAVCGAALDSRRKKYCSNRCRQQAYRDRHRQPRGAREERETVTMPKNKLKICPECGGKIRVVRTLTDSSRLVKRVRQCEQCEQKTVTVEISEREYRNLRASNRRLNDLAADLRARFIEYNNTTIALLKERDFVD